MKWASQLCLCTGWLVAGWLVLALASVAPLQADPRESHKAGLEALEAKRWTAAERFFAAAIEERTEERHNALLGRRYFPHYYLGVARVEQGRCRAALDNFRESERQGKIQKLEDLVQDLKRRRQTCQRLRQEIADLAIEVGEILDQAGDGFESLDRLQTNPALETVWTSGPQGFSRREDDLRQRQGQLRQQLQAAQGRESKDDLQSVEELSNRLLKELEETIASARQVLGDRNAATASALDDVEKLESRARRQLRSVRDLAPYPSNLGRRVSALETQLKKLVDAKEAAQASQLGQLENDLRGAMDQLTRASRRPPKVLSEALESFLLGDHEAVVIALEDADLRGDAAQAQGCILRSAARFHLFVLSGDEAIELEAAAVDDLRNCATQDLTKPSERFFSPRFVRFFDLTLSTEPDATLDEEKTLED